MHAFVLGTQLSRMLEDGSEGFTVATNAVGATAAAEVLYDAATPMGELVDGHEDTSTTPKI